MSNKLESIRNRLTDVIIGSEEPSYLMILGLITDGHILIQGAPGIGKTTLAETLAKSINGSFSRVQFTPDILSSDLLGYSIYHQGREEFEFVRGPVFSNVLLADEINRTSPRVQSSLLECMNERQVSIDGYTHKLSLPFMVIATQNNVHSTGTFALPEPQLDRFMLSISMGIPDSETQTKILLKHSNEEAESRDFDPLIELEEIIDFQSQVKLIHVSENICSYITEICDCARRKKGMTHSISSRAAISLMRASQAVAWLEGNKAVYPEDVKSVVGSVLSHRIASNEDIDIGGVSGAELVIEILNEVDVP
ncbi:MoxR family ATPase [Verrucomicrobiales bacterium]|nr:MoxR family ATPase [Verrucomicrobiales bacterium]